MSGETEAEVSAWTIDSLHVHLLALIAKEVTGLRELLAERDRRYQERFEAQEKAVIVALTQVNKEFSERITQVREENRLSLQSSEKAILKAESANEKRFESVNEFRAQQADMIQTFSRKDESETRFTGLIEKIESCISQIVALSASTLPRNEYDRAHVDLADKVLGGDKAMNDKLEAQVKAFDQRMNQLQAQLSAIEAVTR